MRFSKSKVALCAFVIGASILVTSAFADVMIGSGYYGLKNSAKTTMAKLTNEVDNFSVELIASAKIDGEVFAEESEKIKYDIENQAHENSGTDLSKGKTNERYYYNDANKRITKNFETGTYHVWNKSNDKNVNKESKILNNPFDEEQAADAERIVDAFVGSLQDIIQVEETDGKKMYIGNLSDTQVPPLVNAISSFALKYSILDERQAKRLDVPYPKENIYVIEASGKAVENEDGILESIIGSASISANDKDGIEHIYTIELSVEVKDINNTIVAEPDLTGQEVEYSKDSGFDLDEKYIGKYKKDIVKREGNSFVKHGEKILEITSIENDNIIGKYYEVYKEGYTPDTILEFEFSSPISNDRNYYISFNYNEGGKEKTAVIRETDLANLTLELDVVFSEEGNGYSTQNYNEDSYGEFIRVFD